MTREEAIRILEVNKPVMTKRMSTPARRYVEAFEMAISALKGEWIPVSERLPDNNVRVLCSAISTSISGGYTRFVGCCDNGDWFVQTDAETVSYPRQYEVTAWMPLPEVYKAESEKNEQS